ncbi:MAG TPA: hypothetical protein VFB80_17320 [Pirellulaceae bacterium]|jgi:acyl carrier protein|nr:hypothetical protein [Pirellulaceae bacterium]
MDRHQIEDVVVSAIRIINQGRTPEHQLAESADAALYGAGSPLDSLGLVALLIEVEEGLREEGRAISLSDERAVSQKHSPFRSVPALVDYIAGRLGNPA